MKIARSKYDVFVEIVCLLCIIGVFIYLVIAWPNIPTEVPGHYNAVGEVDRITKKDSLIVLPIVTLIMYIGLSILIKFPQAWNTGVRVTEENRERVYRILKNMLNTTKLLVVLGFTYITVNSIMAKPLHILFLPIYLSLMFGSLIYFIVKLVKAR